MLHAAHAFGNRSCRGPSHALRLRRVVCRLQSWLDRCLVEWQLHKMWLLSMVGAAFAWVRGAGATGGGGGAGRVDVDTHPAGTSTAGTGA